MASRNRDDRAIPYFPVKAKTPRELARSASSGAALTRNAQCPCGSGRKFKQCCLERMDVPVPKPAEPEPQTIADRLVWNELFPDLAQEATR